MPKQVRLVYEARMELRDIAAFHREKVGPNSARKITDRILSELDRLANFPQMGFVPPVKMAAEAGYRVLIVKDYLCFYRVEETEVLVYHIVHGSTDYIRRIFR